MPNITLADKILSSVKGLRHQMQPGEEPVFTIPGIWDGGREPAKLCEVILTNQRLFGYAYSTFPRERLFLDSLNLTNITLVSVRQKSSDPIFRELLVSNGQDGQRNVYIRAPRQKIENLYAALRSVTETMTASTQSGEVEVSESTEQATKRAPAYDRQQIRTQFETSPLGITFLFVGGLVLEIVGALSWSATHSAQVGLPLCIAGFIAVLMATWVRRRHH